MFRARSHIAFFFLALSLTLAFPAQYWHVPLHDCEGHEENHPPADTHLPGVSEAHADCAICDTQVLSFASMLEVLDLSIDALPEGFIFLQGNRVSQGLSFHHYQRGPPQEIGFFVA